MSANSVGDSVRAKIIISATLPENFSNSPQQDCENAPIPNGSGTEGLRLAIRFLAVPLARPTPKLVILVVALCDSSSRISSTSASIAPGLSTTFIDETCQTFSAGRGDAKLWYCSTASYW